MDFINIKKQPIKLFGGDVQIIDGKIYIGEHEVKEHEVDTVVPTKLALRTKEGRFIRGLDLIPSDKTGEKGMFWIGGLETIKGMDFPAFMVDGWYRAQLFLKHDRMCENGFDIYVDNEYYDTIYKRR